MAVNTLCASLAGNPVKILTITENVKSYALTKVKLQDPHAVSEVKKMLKLRPLRARVIERKPTIRTHAAGQGTGGGNYTGYNYHKKAVALAAEKKPATAGGETSRSWKGESDDDG